MVVLPLVPVTSSTGTSWTPLPVDLCGVGEGADGPASEPFPRPTEAKWSSARKATPRAAAAPQREQGRDCLAGDLVAQARRRGLEVRRARPATAASAAAQAHSLTSVAA